MPKGCRGSASLWHFFECVVGLIGRSRAFFDEGGGVKVSLDFMQLEAKA